MKQKYDVAISFAGEDRKIAREFADRLATLGYSVFFDEFEKSALWGADLSVELKRIYRDAARFCVIFISKHYVKKPWTNHERQAAISGAFKRRKAYILPIRLDNTELPGLPDTIGYISLNQTSVSEVCDLLVQKIGNPNFDDKGKEISVDRIREVLAACYRRAIFTPMHAQMNPYAMIESLAECRVTLQKLIVYVEPETLQHLVAGIIGELDLIERRKDSVLDTRNYHSDADLINGAKLRIIASLQKLKIASGISFELPEDFGDGFLYTKEDADLAPF
jgi:hypothetical protein